MAGKEPGSDVVILGGGVIGCSIAYYLAKAGVKATLVERNAIGSEASAAAAGMLAPLAEAPGPGPFLNMALHSLDMYLGLAAEIKSLTGIDIEYSSCGIIRAAFSKEEAAELESRLPWQTDLGLEVRGLSSMELQQIEPAVSPQAETAILSPREGHINPARLTLGVAQAARHLGATILEGTEVSGLLTSDSRVQRVEVGSRSLAASEVILATGAWAGLMGNDVGVSLPVKPIKGQIVALRSQDVRLRRIVFGGHSYAVPKGDGSIWVGATQEEVGFDKRVTVEGISYLLSKARALVPALASASFEKAWAGFRPGSPDGMPILGPLPGWEGITLAIGHFRNGILLAPITGHLIANYIVRGDSKPLESFSISRFRR